MVGYTSEPMLSDTVTNNFLVKMFDEDSKISWRYVLVQHFTKTTI